MSDQAVHLDTRWPVVGHEWAVRLLSHAIQNDRLSHAYLVTGPAGVGKATLARAFAQALQCQTPDPAARPCGACRSCELTAAARHPDVFWVEPPSADRAISIDQIRELQHHATLSPVEGRWKVLIVRDADRATLHAANALLKTLEEPPPHVILILTAPMRDALLPTIVSRCQVLALRPLPTSLVEDALIRQWNVSAEEAALWSRLSGGRLGAALALRDDEGIRGQRAEWLSMLQSVMAGDELARFEAAETVATGGSEVATQLLSLWLSWWRDVLLTQAGCGEEIAHIDQRSMIARAASTLTRKEVLDILSLLRDTLDYIQANGNVRLGLEACFLHLPQAELGLT